MNRFVLLLFLFIGLHNQYFSKDKTPVIFKWQNKFAEKHIRKYIEKDTSVKTSQAQIHIHYSKKRDKPYMLMLHGMGMNARTNWYNQIEPLSKEYNLILPDLIYFGESTSGTQDMSVEFQVQQIREAITKIGINEPIYIVGFSYGGLTAAMYNELFHEQVKKMVIIDGPVKYFSADMADSIAHSYNVKHLGDVVVPTTIKEFDAMQLAVMAKPIKVSTKMKNKIITHLFLPTKPIRVKQLEYLTEHQKRYQNYTYNIDKTPTLLIWGEKDGIIPKSVGIALNQHYPNTTTLLLLPKAKHDAHFSESEKVNKEITEFIKH